MDQVSEVPELVRGAVFVAVGGATVVFVFAWFEAARSVFVERHRHKLNLLMIAVFVAPFAFGLCWLVGWATS